jgi:G3E family GTPase
MNVWWQGAPSKELEQTDDEDTTTGDTGSDVSSDRDDNDINSSGSQEEMMAAGMAGGDCEQLRTEPDEGQDVGKLQQAVPKELLAGQKALLIDRQHRKTGCVLRSKGFVWFPSSPDTVIEWSSSGVLLELATAHPWFCTVPEVGGPAVG